MLNFDFGRNCLSITYVFNIQIEVSSGLHNMEARRPRERTIVELYWEQIHDTHSRFKSRQHGKRTRCVQSGSKRSLKSQNKEEFRINTETGPLSPEDRLFTSPETLAVEWVCFGSYQFPLLRSELRGQAAQR